MNNILLTQKEKDFWAEFYQKNGISIDDLNTQVIDDVPDPDGPWWNILVARGMNYKQVSRVLCERFDTYFQLDINELDDIIVEQRRNPFGSYVVGLKGYREADYFLKNKSANDLGNLTVITLLERLLVEIYYFDSSGEHLDINNVTLCSGSRVTKCDYEIIPTVCFRNNKVCILWTNPEYKSDQLRSRIIRFEA